MREECAVGRKVASRTHFHKFHHRIQRNGGRGASLGAVGQDYDNVVFKCLAPCSFTSLELTFTRELVFVPPGGAQALLWSVARRRHAETAKAGVTLDGPWQDTYYANIIKP